MSVIIRLQNLPWSANALDVRNFFKGLSIPDGGVHIVGGEMGDAFIAFSTDEDARQAMMMNGGKIKEVQITLLLSSRAQMQKVIEEARRTTMSFMQLSAQSSAPPQPAPVAAKVPVPTTTVSQQPQPPVISLSGFLAQNLNSQKSQIMQAQSIYSEIPGLGFLNSSTGMFQPNAPAAGLFSALNAQSYNSADPNSAFAQLSEQLKKATEAEKKAAAKGLTNASGKVGSSNLSSKKESGEKSSRRSRSSSRERDRRRSSRDRSRSRSRDRDRGRRRSGRDRSRSRSHDRRSRSRSRDRRDRRRRSRSRDRRGSRSRDVSREKESKVDKSARGRVSRFSDRAELKSANTAAPIAVPEVEQKPFVSPWDTPIQLNLMKLSGSSVTKPILPPVIAPQSVAIASNPSATRNEQPQSSSNNQSNPQASLYPAVNYGSFQASKPISSEHLSKLQELHAMRDPRAFQGQPGQSHNRGQGHGQGSGRDNNGFGKNQNQNAYSYSKQNDEHNSAFRMSSSKNKSSEDSFNERHHKLSEHDDRSESSDETEGQSVKISNMDTSTGYGELRRFFFGQSISSNGIKMINDRNGKRTGVAYIRFLRKDGKRYALSRDGMELRRAHVKLESITDKEFEDAIDSYRPTYDDTKNNWVELNDQNEDKKSEDVIEIMDDSSERGNKFGSLVVWNLPNMTTELDLMRIFSDFTVVEVLIIKNYKNPKQFDGYVKFHRLEDARKAYDSIHKHYIRNKRVYIKLCTDIEYDAAKNEYDEPEDNDGVVAVQPSTVDLDDSVQDIVEDSKGSKSDVGDNMDLVVEEKAPVDGEKIERPFHDLMGDDPPLDQLIDSNSRQVASVSESEEDQWDVKQPRDPRNIFSRNFSKPPYQNQQQYPQQHAALQLQQHFSSPQSSLQQQNQLQQSYSPQQQNQLMPPHLLPQQHLLQQQNQQQQPFSSPPYYLPPQQNQQLPSYSPQQQFFHQQQNLQQPPLSSPQQSLLQQQNQQQPYSSQQHSVLQQQYQQQQSHLSPQNPLSQQQNQRSQSQRPQEQHRESVVAPQKSVGGFGGEFSRDPRRRQNVMNQQPNESQSQTGFQSDNTRDGVDNNKNNYGSSQSRFGASSSFMGPKGNDRYDQLSTNSNDQSNGKTTFIVITNLEYGLQESIVREFFDHEGFNPKHVHFIRSHTGRPTGECLVEFDTPQEAEATMLKNGSQIGKRKGFIKHLDKHQVMDVMQRINRGRGGRGQKFYKDGNNFGGGYNNFGDHSNNFSGSNNFASNNFGRGNFANDNYGGNSSGNDRSANNASGGLSDSNFSENNGRQRIGNFDNDQNQNFASDNASSNIDHDACNNQQNEVDYFVDDSHDQPEEIPVNIDETSQEDVKDQEESEIPEKLTEEIPCTEQLAVQEPADTPAIQSEPEHPEDQSLQCISPKNDGREPDDPPLDMPCQLPDPDTSCDNIIILSNLPFRARNEDIAKHFKEYNVTVNDVKRRYMRDGRATGEAMVRFQSPDDAQRALQSHQQRRLGGRYIRMKILSEFN
ncbi:uncharacterized protein LOC131692430 [Topomyia yanbarensis]|uniref:uncharacterized protein LOC131692430 n=1 Tax=Topomyia yanbarensis TaxID=2498891 RepID=UPI00273CDBA9|nr:uncharacterized protein LOC131692430 [Topomyia yanbarensis]